ncbi:CCR4 carbon catabolite repression 4-like [Perkinsus chesapeaki]|uniref:CCR4 carbon catabolite repression 4-like n=1 Tax=Perkinsus chesapeaki TaxID=330153 RepID=A0A7J6LI22_PERCH|nr:CCR4 carbon catabolite repression 4-like [Perkinsus chesapeaki]
MVAKDGELAKTSPASYRAGVKALATKTNKEDVMEALHYRTERLLREFEETYNESADVKSIVGNHKVLFRQVLLWGQENEPEIVEDIFEAVASATEDTLQLLSAVLMIDGIEETPAFTLETSLLLLPAVLDVIAQGVERTAEMYEVEDRDVQPSVVEVDLSELVTFVMKSREPFCVRNALIEVEESQGPTPSGNLVVAQVKLKIQPGHFVLHVEDGYLPYKDLAAQPVIITITPVKNPGKKHKLPVITATSLELDKSDEIEVDVEDSQDDMNDGTCIFYKTEHWSLVEDLSTIDDVLRAPLALVVLEHRNTRSVSFKLAVASIHLKAGTSQESDERRQEQLQWLTGKIDRASVAHNSAVLVCGDFNAEPTETSIQSIVETNDWKSVYPLGDGDRRPTTVHQRKGMAIIRRHIDYMWYSGSLNATGYFTFPDSCPLLPSKNYPSDHLHLVARFSLSEGQSDDTPSAAFRTVIFPDIVPVSKDKPERTIISLQVDRDTQSKIREILSGIVVAARQRGIQLEMVGRLSEVGSWTVDAIERADINILSIGDSNVQAIIGFALARNPGSVLLLDTQHVSERPPVVEYFCHQRKVPLIGSTEALARKMEDMIWGVRETKLSLEPLAVAGWVKYFKQVLS